MKSSFTVANVFGTKVQVHFTFVLLLAIIGLQLYVYEGMGVAIHGVLFMLSIFGCVLLHEFGHVAAALRYGITTPKITLLPIGGLASLSKIPKEPVKELVVAIAGPMVNIVIALVLIMINGGLPPMQLPTLIHGDSSFIDSLIWANLLLVAFNLVPAFPMDGGRVFRALLATFVSRGTATHYAVKIGQGIAIAGAVFAMGTGQILLAFVAVFIFFAGKGEEAMVDQELLLEGHTAGEAGMSEFTKFHLDDDLTAVIDQLLKGDQDVFPVVNEACDCVAVLNFREVVNGIEKYGVTAKVRDAVNTVPEQISEDAPAFDAWQKLAGSGLAGAAIVGKNGQLTKWLTLRQFGEFMVVQTLAKHRFPHSGSPL